MVTLVVVVVTSPPTVVVVVASPPTVVVVVASPPTVVVVVSVVAGGSSTGPKGLPQAQRARGMPSASTKTAVPASKTAKKGTAIPPEYPWLITSVFSIKMAEVSEFK